jgi:hypothetical protein
MRLDIYNNVNQEHILNAIGIKYEDIPRPRGVGIDNGKILIHTRTGGGNRESYEEQNNFLASNKYYLSDEDEEFDCTYANFWFKIPEELTEELLKLENKEAKAILGDTVNAINLKLGNEKERNNAIDTVNNNLKAIGSDIVIPK